MDAAMNSAITHLLAAVPTLDANEAGGALTWNHAGMYFWRDYVDGAEPYFEVPANSLEDWPFNFPNYQMFPVLNLAVSLG